MEERSLDAVELVIKVWLVLVFWITFVSFFKLP